MMQLRQLKSLSMNNGPEGNGSYGLTESTGIFRDVFLGFYNNDKNPEVIFYRPGGNTNR